jgi:hypothetical protein
MSVHHLVWYVACLLQHRIHPTSPKDPATDLISSESNVFVYSQVTGTLAVPPSDVRCCGRPTQASRDVAFVPTRDATDTDTKAPDGEGPMGALSSKGKALLNVTKLMIQKASRAKANREQRAAQRSENKTEGAAKVCCPCTFARRACTCASRLSKHVTKKPVPNHYLRIKLIP